jgi:hypothetical protein
VAITEESRHRLYERLEEVLGREDANTMMEHLPPVGWSDVATKSDLAHLEASMRKEFERLDQRFDHMQERTDDRFDRMQERTNERFDRMEEKTDERFTHLETNLRNELTGEIRSTRTTLAEQSMALIADQRQWMKAMFVSTYTFLGLVVAFNAMF